MEIQILGSWGPLTKQKTTLSRLQETRHALTASAVADILVFFVDPEFFHDFLGLQDNSYTEVNLENPR